MPRLDLQQRLVTLLNSHSNARYEQVPAAEG